MFQVQPLFQVASLRALLIRKVEKKIKSEYIHEKKNIRRTMQLQDKKETKSRKSTFPLWFPGIPGRSLGTALAH